MTFQAKDTMKRASVTLQDDGAVRWTATELLDYLNDGMRELISMKPTAKTQTVQLSLASGTKQTLPAQYTILSRVICNRITGSKRAIRPLAKREILDSQIPGWQDPDVLPFAAAVTHVIHEGAEPRTYYVVPGNDGNGIIEAMVGAYPTPVSAPTAPANLEIENYTATVDLDDIYMNALTDYILYRAFSKDGSAPNAANRAVAHYELFKASVTGFAANEAAMSVAASAMRPQG